MDKQQPGQRPTQPATSGDPATSDPASQNGSGIGPSDEVKIDSQELAGAFDQYGPAIGANSRIDDGDMNRAAGKVFINSEQIERAGMNILRWNIVSEVDNLSRGIRGKDHSFHRANEIILGAEVCKKRDD